MSPDTPLSAVAPDLQAALAAIPDLGDLSADRLQAIRTQLQGAEARLGRDGAITVSKIFLPARGNAPPIAALLYRPDGPSRAPMPALLTIHGGGFVAGAAQREDAAMRHIAGTLGCAVLTPDYRLAPDDPFPAALDDCDAALDWLQLQRDIDAERIAIRGVSAGGGLAMGLMLLRRDSQRPLPAFLQLVYPMLDDRTSDHPFTGKFVWTAAANKFGWDAVLQGQERTAPPYYAVPGRAKDLSGLPPVFLAVGSIDLFAGEALSLANALVDCGVPVELHLYPGAYHGFTLVPNSWAAQAFARESLAALQRAITRP